ncbi:MAG TPA: acetate/propionate family kinase [Terriglobales bacterium]|nr:acetate/propionate family kinase [Terriglobales bacterium]
MSKPPGDSAVLALNSGSSSLKLALYSFHNGMPSKLFWGEAEEIGSKNGRLWFRGDPSLSVDEVRGFASTGDAADYLIGALRKRSLPKPIALGHRIVHGGPSLRQHQRITSDVLAQLQDAVPFAPLHVPPALEVIRRAMSVYPAVPHFACFDTAFHRTIPDYAARLPFNIEFWKRGLRRYGFHGLSCESIVRALGDDLVPHTVVAHLGNGCSLTAIENGRSVETTMGLTPTGGIMMGTRSGDLDPGVLFNLLRSSYGVEQVDSLVNHNSGLLGVSGTSSDMRRLLESRKRDDHAHLAVEMFCYQIRKSIGAMAAVLGGIDLLVFTGGIGEHSPTIRQQISTGLEHLGIRLDEIANQQNAARIAWIEASCDVRVIESDEDREIAIHSYKLAGEGTT